MSALTKQDLIDSISEQIGLSKREAKLIVEGFFTGIRESLESNDTVRLSGFGNFILRDKKDRPGRNPKTGEPVTVTARRVVTFRCSNKLRDRVDKLALTLA